MPGRAELPDTIKRSPSKAQDTWVKAHDSAVKTYGEGERAHRTAFAALKHSFEKIGDHWEAKDEKGPSDPGSRKRGATTYGGIDAVGNTKDELYERAKKAGIRGRSNMKKEQLAEALSRKE